MVCRLRVCAELKPSDIDICSPVTQECETFTGKDFRYVETIARVMDCQLRMTVGKQNCSAQRTDVWIPLSLDNTVYKSISQPVSIKNSSIFFNRHRLMDIPFWFHKPFSWQVWTSFLVLAVIVLPVVVVILEINDKKKKSLWTRSCEFFNNVFRYLTGYLNQFPSDFDTHKLFHGCWLYLLLVYTALYSSNLISYLLSDSSVMQFQNVHQIIRAIKNERYTLAIALPIVGEEVTAMDEMTEREVVQKFLKNFPTYSGVRDLVNRTVILRDGLFNKGLVKFFWFQEETLQSDFEDFLRENKKTFIFDGDNLQNEVINCGELFERLQFESGSKRVFGLNPKINDKTKAKLNQAIATTYESDVYEVLTERFVIANDTEVNKYCGIVMKGTFPQLKWVQMGGVITVCSAMFGLSILMIVVEIIWVKMGFLF